MITITKDNDKKVVTQGAYKEFYEHLGYEIVKDKKPFEKKVETNKEAETNKEVETKKDTKKEDKSKLENYSRK